MQNYNETISKVRDLARDQVRLHAVNRYRTSLYGVQQFQASLEQDIALLNKEVAIAEFKKSEIKDNDPEKVEKSERFDKTIESLKLSIEATNKRLEENAKEQSELGDKIAKVETGETKMCIEKVELAAKTLIDEFVKSQAKEITA